MGRPRSPRPLRAAVVGAGRMGRWHARAIETVGGVVAAVVDPDVERARLLSPGAAVLPSIDALRASSIPLDVVHVCTPLEAHAPAIQAAVDAGLHIVAEKPVAPDARTTRTLLRATTAAGLVLVPVHQFLFQPGVVVLVRRGPQLGPLVRCTFDAASAGTETSGVAPDELVADILPHPLSLFARLVTTDVGRLEWSVLTPAAGELRAVATAGDTTLEITITSRGRPTRAELEAMGARATARVDLYHGFTVFDRGAATRVRKAARPFTTSLSTLGAATVNLASRARRRETAYPGLRDLVAGTYAAIATGAPPPISAEETVAVAEARDRILERIAAAAGSRSSPYEVPATEET